MSSCAYRTRVEVTGIEPEQVFLRVYDVTDIGEETESEELIGTYVNQHYWLMSGVNWMMLMQDIGTYIYGGDDRLPCQICVKPEAVTEPAECIEQFYYDVSESVYNNLDPVQVEQGVDIPVWSNYDLPAAYQVSGFSIPVPDDHTWPLGTEACNDNSLSAMIAWIGSEWLSGPNFILEQIETSHEYVLYPKFGNGASWRTPIDQDYVNPPPSSNPSCVNSTAPFRNARFLAHAQFCDGSVSGGVAFPDTVDSLGGVVLHLQLNIFGEYSGSHGGALDLYYAAVLPPDGVITDNSLLAMQLIKAVDRKGIWEYSGGLFNTFNFGLTLQALS